MKKKYNWKITLKKFGISLAEILVVGFISWASDKPELLILIPIAEAMRNYLKNKNL